MTADPGWEVISKEEISERSVLERVVKGFNRRMKRTPERVYSMGRRIQVHLEKEDVRFLIDAQSIHIKKLGLMGGVYLDVVSKYFPTLIITVPAQEQPLFTIPVDPEIFRRDKGALSHLVFTMHRFKREEDETYGFHQVAPPLPYTTFEIVSSYPRELPEPYSYNLYCTMLVKIFFKP